MDFSAEIFRDGAWLADLNLFIRPIAGDFIEYKDYATGKIKIVKVKKVLIKFESADLIITVTDEE